MGKGVGANVDCTVGNAEPVGHDNEHMPHCVLLSGLKPIYTVVVAHQVELKGGRVMVGGIYGIETFIDIQYEK